MQQEQSTPILEEQLDDFRLELYKTQKGRYYAKAFHIPTERSFISESFESIEDAVSNAMEGCIKDLDSAKAS
ncbi:MAG: hypothetical protein KDD53_04855 [Bdellovibrionales bacterium]|nr:hypothetical protein [Bdellovibrionales bacterium]